MAKAASTNKPPKPVTYVPPMGPTVTFTPAKQVNGGKPPNAANATFGMKPVKPTHVDQGYKLTKHKHVEHSTKASKFNSRKNT